MEVVLNRTYPRAPAQPMPLLSVSDVSLVVLSPSHRLQYQSLGLLVSNVAYQPPNIRGWFFLFFEVLSLNRVVSVASARGVSCLIMEVRPLWLRRLSWSFLNWQNIRGRVAPSSSEEPSFAVRVSRHCQTLSRSRYRLRDRSWPEMAESGRRLAGVVSSVEVLREINLSVNCRASEAKCWFKMEVSLSSWKR